jgi:predicted TIM-barrel fold metal-dependent hydrolase
MGKIDAHVHVFDRVSPRYPRRIDALVPPEREARAERLLREMDASGIERAVLIGMGGTSLIDHRYVADCLKRWPDRFVATGLVDKNDPDPAARLRELKESAGISGIRLSGTLGRSDRAEVENERADDSLHPGVRELFLGADGLGLNVNLYCSSGEADNIESLVRDFPNVTVSLDHMGICPVSAFVADRWGRPRFDNQPIPPPDYECILSLARYPNVYVKISGEYAFSGAHFPFDDLRPLAERLYRSFGADRLMWGSDFPWILENPGYGRLAELIDRHLPSIGAGERDKIMGGNAAGVWFS